MTYPNRSSRSPWLRSRAVGTCLAALCAAMFVYFGGVKTAHAVPSFARKYKTSCTTCHTVYPKLNPFGEAFRRNGFRFPSKDGSLDSDNVQAKMLPLGQDAYKKLFPDSVWPAAITQAVPLSVMIVGSTAVNLPGSAAHDAAGNTFAWNDFAGEASLYAAGSFNDKLTYFTELAIEDGGIDVEHAYLLWNDIIGPRHAFNLNIGRFGPTLSSWGMHSTYAADTFFPAVAPGALYAAGGAQGGAGMSYGNPVGLELNGIVGHRVDYSLGWQASGATGGLLTPNSQNAYAHIGFKVGGMSLDGEGPSGAQVANPAKPWSETALTLDAFGYHALSRLDNATSLDGSPTRQDDSINTLGGIARLDIGSFSVIGGAMLEHHSSPYAGSAADTTAGTAGVPDTNSGTAIVQFDELDYIVFPWLVPVIRTEFTHLSLDAAHGGGSASLLRIQPGVSMLFRPNIKLVLLGNIERGTGAPPTDDAWGAAGGSVAAQPKGESKLEAEQITGSLVWAF